MARSERGYAAIATLESQLKESHEKATSTLVTNLNTRYRQLDREKPSRLLSKTARRDPDSERSAINYRIIQQEVETNKQLLMDCCNAQKKRGGAQRHPEQHLGG